MKLFRAEIAKSLFGELRTTGFAFDVEVLARASRAELRIDEFRVAWAHQPGSKVNPLTDGLRMYAEVRQIRRTLAATS